MKGKKIVSTLLALLLLASLPVSALAAEWDISKGDITVNAESGGQTVRQGGGAAVPDSAPVITGTSKENNVTITYNFDSSGTLKTQIQEGADCDLFISAGQKQMNQLDKDASADVNTEGLDFVLAGSRFNILENKVTLVVPEGNPKNILSFDDLAAGLKDGSILLAMGNSDVPVGQYTQKILKYYELNEDALAAAGCLTYGTNVKEVTTQVSEAVVDCGVIYCTDAFSAGLTIVDYATAEMCGQVIYPAAVLNISQNTESAQAFLDFCRTPEATAIFEAVGFSAAA